MLRWLMPKDLRNSVLPLNCLVAACVVKSLALVNTKNSSNGWLQIPLTLIVLMHCLDEFWMHAMTPCTQAPMRAMLRMVRFN